MTPRGIAAATLAFSIIAPMVSAQTPNDGSSVSDREQLYLEVVLNDVPTGRLIAVVRERGRLTAGLSDLLSFGLAVDAADERVALDTMQDAIVRYDASNQRLHIDRRPATLPGQWISAGHATDRPETQTSRGMLLNYDVHHQRHADGTLATASWLESRTFGSLGVLSATARYQRRASTRQPASSAFVRQDTTWSRTDRERRLVVSAGDVVTGAHAWGRAIRLGGVSIARNFALRPDLVTHPVPEFAGEAAVPSAVELLLNGRLVAERTVQPGPFAIGDAPVVNGAGMATIVTTDAVGRQTMRTVPFYVSTSLLRPGLVDYSASFGAVRRGYGTRSFEYGPIVGSGVVRYGATSALTLEGQAAASPAATSGGAGASVRIGHHGVVSASASVSSAASPAPDRGGHRHTLRYEYQASRFGVLIRRDAQSRGFAEPGIADLAAAGRSPAAPERLLQMFVSVSASRAMPVALGYIRADGASGTSSVLTASTSRTITPRSRLAVSAVHRRGALSLQASMTLQLGPSGTARIGAARSAEGGGAMRVSLHRPAPLDGGIGVDVAASSEGTGERHGTLTWRTPAFDAQAGADARGGAATTWASVRGSIVATGRAVMPTGRVNDAFILVDTNGHAGVPILFENRRVGHTDRRGRLLVPGVTAYHAARIAIDPLHLPVDVQTGIIEQRVAVERHAGAVVSFPLRRVTTATLRLVDIDGAPIPVGARVVHEQSGTTFVAGWTGLVYLDQVSRQNTLTVTLSAGGTCAAAFDADTRPLRPGAVMRLTCR